MYTMVRVLVFISLCLPGEALRDLQGSADWKEAVAARSQVNATRAFHFTIINNSSLPLDVLAGAVYKLNSTVYNAMPPGAEHQFGAYGGLVYDIMIRVDNPNLDSRWSNRKEILKDVSEKVVSKVVSKTLEGGLGLVLTNHLAAVTAAASFAALASLPAPGPAWAALASTAAYWGVVQLVSLAASSVSSTVVNKARLRLEKRAAKHIEDEQGPTFGQETADSPDSLFLFDTVVTEKTVRDAVAMSFPMLNLSRTLVSRSAAEQYFLSAAALFQEKRLGKVDDRKFIVTGGFIAPEDVQGQDNKTWTKLNFVPLQLGEVRPSYGCGMPSNPKYWRTRHSTCVKACNGRVIGIVGALVNSKRETAKTLSKMRGSDPAEWPHWAQREYEMCMTACVNPFTQALAAEDARNSRVHSLEGLVGQSVSVTTNEELFQKAQEDSLLPADPGSMGLQGKLVKLLITELVAKIHFEQEGFDAHLWLPLEALENSSGKPLLQPKERLHVFSELAAPASYGECWSRCGPKSNANENDLWWHGVTTWFREQTMGGGHWCPASADIEEFISFDMPRDHGAVCRKDDDCGLVKSSDVVHDLWHQEPDDFRCKSGCKFWAPTPANVLKRKSPASLVQRAEDGHLALQNQR
eukprot:TRINITY_DN48530_c0_g1_i1.p1 TRINITY_DN48530_c0_g1~~TRINITY_DN48530_c0_g1_i1.p1  ORF type:complete len:635 (-),score=98.96 TRINITY_DN48530_c0_g1_i1:139-2043(-)